MISAIDAALASAFGTLRRSVQRNLVVLTVAFLRVLGAVRSGHGHLSLAALYRVMPTAGTPHAREKRLHRFLNNPRLDPCGVTDGLVRLIVGQRGRGLWPIVFDQTKSAATQALFAGVPFAGRIVPLSVYTFEYPWRETAVDSQNQLEEIFLLDLETALPQGVRGVYIGDRGYARAALLRQSHREGRLYVIRGRGGTGVYYRGQRIRLRDLPCGMHRAIRYSNVCYHAKERILVDVVALHDPVFQGPWWLLVPPASKAILPTELMVDLYRQRMQIEQSFRDFKTHLGLRGLKLTVRVPQRTGRLLLAFCIAYCLALVLGVSTEAEQARLDLEIPRRRVRHDTTRTLSALSLAMQMLSHPTWRIKAHQCLQQIAITITTGAPILQRPPPKITNNHLLAA